MPLFRVPGNHDVGNALMREQWLARHGVLDYHFRYRDVLFLVLDTQDPPQSLAQLLRPGTGATAPLPASLAGVMDDDLDEQEVIGRIQEVLATDPAAMNGLMKAVKDGTQPGQLSEEQTDRLVAAVAEHDDVRWTVLLMHMPVWQGDGHPSLDRVRAALGARPYTAFAGHCHHYRRTVLDGREHIRLGATGGIRLLDTPEGNFDHLAWVTMTATGPRIANVLLDGVLDAAGAPVGPGQAGDPVV